MKLTEETKQKISNSVKTKIAVKNIDDNKIFESASEASRYYNIKKAAILMCAKGQRKTAGGYKWETTTVEKKPLEYTIIRIEDNKAYLNVTDASKDNNISRAAIYKCLNGTMKTAAGYHWKYK